MKIVNLIQRQRKIVIFKAVSFRNVAHLHHSTLYLLAHSKRENLIKKKEEKKIRPGSDFAFKGQ